MGSLNDPALVDWLATLAISIGVALIVAGVLSIVSARLLDLAPEHKLWAFIVGLAFLCSLAASPLTDRQSWSIAILYYCLPVVVTFTYFLPTAIAIGRHHKAFQSVFILNMVFGWTVVGWIAALMWATRHERVSAIESMGYRITPFGAVPIKSRVDSPPPQTSSEPDKRSA